MKKPLSLMVNVRVGVMEGPHIDSGFPAFILSPGSAGMTLCGVHGLTWVEFKHRFSVNYYRCCFIILRWDQGRTNRMTTFNTDGLSGLVWLSSACADTLELTWKPEHAETQGEHATSSLKDQIRNPLAVMPQCWAAVKPEHTCDGNTHVCMFVPHRFPVGSLYVDLH